MSKIYIRQDIKPPEKLKVLLHELSHYLHLTKFFEQENRSECEIIAQGAVFFVLREFGIETSNEPVLAELTQDPDRTKHLSSKIKQISAEITQMLK
jgi:hypothetical protein